MNDEELTRIDDEGCGCTIASGYGCAAEPLVVEVRRLNEVERRHDALYAHFADVHSALGKWDDKTLTAAGSVRRLVTSIDRLRELLLSTRARDVDGEPCWCHIAPYVSSTGKHATHCLDKRAVVR